MIDKRRELNTKQNVNTDVFEVKKIKKTVFLLQVKTEFHTFVQNSVNAKVKFKISAR